MKFGLQTDGDIDFFIVKDAFSNGFADLIGATVTAEVSSVITGDVWNFIGTAVGHVSSDTYGALVTYAIDMPSSGSFLLPITGSLVNWNMVHPDIAAPVVYENRSPSAVLSGWISTVLDVSGSGTASGVVSGNISYYSLNDEVTNSSWKKISPAVGDIIKIPFKESSWQEYEITKVVDRDLQSGLNPFLGEYVFKCSAVRRDPSKELIDGITSMETDASEQSSSVMNDWHEIVSDGIFDYSVSAVDIVDGINSDNVYGNY